MTDGLEDVHTGLTYARYMAPPTIYLQTPLTFLAQQIFLRVVEIVDLPRLNLPCVFVVAEAYFICAERGAFKLELVRDVQTRA